MANRVNKRQIKKIEKEIDKLIRLLEKLEIRPCKGDADINQREEEVKDLKKHIASLKNQRNKLIYPWWKRA